jgi:hypothetical protein
MAKPILPVHNGTGKTSEKGEHDDDSNGKSLLSAEAASSSLVSGAVYCTVSAAMVILNKFALSGFDFTCPNLLLLFQCITAVAFVKGAELFGVWRVERLRWDVVKV